MAYNSSLPFNALPMPVATPFVKGNATSCIRVSNLPKQATEPWLRLVFSTFGSIEDLDIYSDTHPGSAVIRFATPEQASKALQLDGSFSHGSALHVHLEPQPQNALTPNAMVNVNHRRGSNGPNMPYYTPFMPNGSFYPDQSMITLPSMGREASPTSTTSSPDSAYGGAPFYGAGHRPRHSSPTRPMVNGHPVHKNLYVLNLPLDATTDQLASLFGNHGTVVHCVILAMLDAQARRRGFIDMSTSVEAKEAIECLNGYVWNGYPIEVSYAIVQRSGGPLTGPNVVRRNVPRSRWNCGPRRQPISDDSVMGNGSNYGNGYPATPNGNQAFQVLGGAGDQRRREASSNICIDPYTIFITGLDPVAILDDEDLCHFLQVYGTILSCSLSRDENGISLGYGVATFATPAEANYAREMLDGQMQSGIRLSCKNLHFTRDAWAGGMGAPGYSPYDHFQPAHELQQGYGSFEPICSYPTNGNSTGLGLWPSEVDYFTPRPQNGNTLPPPSSSAARSPSVTRDMSASGMGSTPTAASSFTAPPVTPPILSLAGNLPPPNPAASNAMMTTGSMPTKQAKAPSTTLSVPTTKTAASSPLSAVPPIAPRHAASSPTEPFIHQGTNAAAKNVWGEPTIPRGPRKVEPDVAGISFGPIGSSPEKKESPKLSGSSNSGGSINGGAPASEALTLGLEKLFMELPGSVSAATTPVASS